MSGQISAGQITAALILDICKDEHEEYKTYGKLERNLAKEILRLQAELDARAQVTDAQKNRLIMDVFRMIRDYPEHEYSTFAPLATRIVDHIFEAAQKATS